MLWFFVFVLSIVVSNKYCVVVFCLRLVHSGVQDILCCVFCLRLVHSGVQHILCGVFGLFIFVLCLVYTMFPVSLDCPFLIAPSVSLKFIYNIFGVFPNQCQYGTGTMFSISITTLTSHRKCL